MTRAQEKALKEFPIVGDLHLRNAFVSGYKQAEKEIKNYLLELVEEEAKFWDDGEMIFRRLKNEIEAL